MVNQYNPLAQHQYRGCLLTLSSMMCYLLVCALVQSVEALVSLLNQTFIQVIVVKMAAIEFMEDMMIATITITIAILFHCIVFNH